jgi:hypothetical protein
MGDPKAIVVVHTASGWQVEGAPPDAEGDPVQLHVPELELSVTLPPGAAQITVRNADAPMPWPMSAVLLVVALLLGVVLPATEPKALRKDAAGPADLGPRWVVWPDDHADRATTEGREATLINPEGAGARDGVTACFEAGPPRPGVMPVSAAWSTTSSDPEGLARVFGKVVVPGSMPRITPIATTHDTTPESTGKALLDVPADAIAVQTCGAVSGPGMQMRIRIPDEP